MPHPDAGDRRDGATIVLDFAGFRFRDAGGVTVAWPFALTAGTIVKDGPGPRRVIRAGAGGATHAVKIVGISQMGRRLRAALGRRPLLLEMRVARRASAAGLPVVVPAACGVQRRAALPVAEALISPWLEGRVLLRAVVRAACRSGDESKALRAGSLYLDVLRRARAAGFADDDFGAGQLLVHDGAEGPEDPRWIDLEAARTAPPDDPAATRAMLAAGLVSWWVATRGDRGLFAALATAAMERLPDPRGGWTALAPAVDRDVAQRMHKQRRKQRVEESPPSVTHGLPAGAAPLPASG